MVVGDQHLQAEAIGLVYAVDAGDPVVHGNQDVRSLLLVCQTHDLRSEAIAVLEAVGDQVIDGCAAGPQCAKANSTGGCPIGVVISDDQQPAPLLDRRGEKACHAGQVMHAFGWNQAFHIAGQLVWSSDPARRENSGEERVHAAFDEPGHDRCGDLARYPHACAHMALTFSTCAARGRPWRQKRQCTRAPHS